MKTKKRLLVSFVGGYHLYTTMESLFAFDVALREAKKNNENLFIKSTDGTDILINPDHVIMVRDHFYENNH